MTTARLPAAVRDLLRSAADIRPDGELLARFVATRDEAAFAELVRRHGGTVWDVCRSILGNRTDADDAFQAVFLTLARRAARLRKPGSVGAWLHGVAVRVARKARAAAARRTAREASAPVPGAVEPADPSWAEVRAVVHDALAALPAMYREPLVACYLYGMTHDDAAAELGLSKAAVKKRLERGRDRLRAVLTSRGLGPAIVLAVGTAPASAVPDHLLVTAPRLAVGSVPVPDAIRRLVEGGVSMTFAKLTASVVLVAGVGFAVAAQDGRPHPATEQPPRPPVTGSKATAQKAAVKEAPATTKTELAGVWTVTWVETNGEALYDAKTRDETLPVPTFVFTDDRCEVKGLRVLYVRDFRFKLDPTKTPKEIDATFVDGRKNGETVIGETVVGIYTIRGNELRICLRLQRPDLGRPKGYVTNSGTTLYTFILTRVGSPGEGAKGTPSTASGDGFDAILGSGNKLYFVLDRPAVEDFRDGVAAFAERIDLAVRTAELTRVRDKDLTVVFFKRDDPNGNSGTLTRMSRDQLRGVSSVPPEKRGDKLLEHAWVLGRLPKDAEPIPPVPRPAPKADAPVPAVGPVPAGRADDKVLTAAELAAGMSRGPVGVYGKRVEFTAVVETVGKGVDGGVVPFVKIEGWPKTNAFGDAFVHNVFPDRVGKAGDRVRVRGRVVAHGYGTLTLWCELWTREEGPAVPRTPNVPPPPKGSTPEEVSIYDRVHPKADLPGPGTEVRNPKDRAVAYYYTNSQRMWGEPRNAGKHVGLYASHDGGQTWKLVNTSFEFKSVFVHPATGHLFAVVEHSWLGSDDKDGQLLRYHADKAVTSADGGGRWKDITPLPGYIADITHFFADPDHPGRACFVANVIRDVIYRPKNDSYSEYDHIRAATPEGQLLMERGVAVVQP